MNTQEDILLTFVSELTSKVSSLIVKKVEFLHEQSKKLDEFFNKCI